MSGFAKWVAVVLLISGMAASVGGTFAGYSDSETSLDNYIVTGSLDLKVNDQDDLPWGTGVDPVVEIADGIVCTEYESTVSVWNAGDTDGVAYILIKNLVDPDGLSAVMDAEIWYDGSLVASGTLHELAGEQIELGWLPAENFRYVTIVLHATAGSPGDCLEWDMQFELVDSWSDTEVSLGNFFQLAHCQSGTRGFWSQWDSHNTYTKAEIDGWLAIIDASSLWLDSVDGDGDFDTDDMECIFANGVGPGATMESRFLAHYLAQRLNQVSGRQSPSTTHDVTACDPANYLNLLIPTSATGQQIVDAIEAKSGTSPTAAQFEIMKDVCDALNNLDI